jgi:isoquinoline 1-oxidoreductase beta subunit
MTNTEKKEKKKGIKRRKFLKYSGLGLGLMIGGVWLARNPIRRKIFDTSETMIPPYMGDTNPLVWIQVTPESKIILHSSKVEMGQGTFTSLAQIVAEELEVSIDQIEVVHATTKTGNIDGFATGGSMSIAALWKPLSEMAATMREMLKTKAAEKLNIDINTLTVEEGKITGGGTTLSYGEIVAGITDWKMPKTPKLKDKSTYKFVGKPVPRVDLEDKILGVPIFGIDASYPDMVYASIVRSRLVDAHMSNFDTSEAQKMPGVIKVIKQNDFVGVVAKSHMEADLARHKIKFDYTKNQEWNLSDIKDKIKVGQGTKTIFQKEGKAIDDIKEEGEIIEMEFSSPIGAHAQLEPNGAVAYYKDGKVEIKISTQVVDITRKEVAKALGIEKADVNIIPTYLGGGFGRRLHTSHAVYVALMSKEVGKPVKCFFDRKQEFQNDTFRPPSHHILKAKVSDDGNLLGIEHQLASGDTMFNSVMAPSIATSILRADIGSIRGAAIMYDGIPEIRGTYYHVDLPFATSFWRSLGLLANAFAIESFLDEIALKTKQDPVAMRLKYLKDNNPYSQRIKKVITTCAERAGYTDIVVGNRAMGFAATIDTGSPCAQVAEVSIEDGKIKVHKVTVAFDCGVAVNPDQVKAQVEGCVCMGLSAALYERMDLKNNKLYPVNYGAYRIAMLRDTPREIDTVLIDGTGIPGPVGEPPLGPIAAAIGNAVRRLIGKRITELPMDLT